MLLNRKPSNFLWIGVALSACGKGGQKAPPDIRFTGFIDTYSPPLGTYTVPLEADSYRNFLKPEEPDPYWINALTMEHWETQASLKGESEDTEIKFTFPSNEPNYLIGYASSWSESSEEIKESSREIFNNLNKVLGVRFIEISETSGVNVVAISESIQDNTAGISYFPNKSFEIGSDVFISTEYSEPRFLNSDFTNYDYEVLVHEIGHALGLKHPFEAQGGNQSILSKKEDNNLFTVMSYTDLPNTFTGNFRPLDWLALAELYGVNKDFNYHDNIYFFRHDTSIFILDGNGLDSIDASVYQEDVHIDLRPGTQSFIEAKPLYITNFNQLTISKYSVIENVYTGSGNDVIIGNDAENIIFANSGDDKIFPSEGADKISSGPGNDQIDLSENGSSTDTLVINSEDIMTGVDMVYGFKQGDDGDIIDLSSFIAEKLLLLPIIYSNEVPIGNISNHILRVVGDNLETAREVDFAINEDVIFGNLNFSKDSGILLLCSASQDTGYSQNFFYLDVSDEIYKSFHLCEFIGDNLDIDRWSEANFNQPSEGFIL